MRRHIGDFLFLFCVLSLWSGAVVVTVHTDDGPDYEKQANCIAEYDYTHPDAPMMDNLVVALEKCR